MNGLQFLFLILILLRKHLLFSYQNHKLLYLLLLHSYQLRMEFSSYFL